MAIFSANTYSGRRDTPALLSKNVDGFMTGQKEKLLFLSVMLVTFMIGFDTTGLGVAIPDIAANLGFGVKEGAWLSVAYTAGFAAFLLPSGIITDKYGFRITLLPALTVFVVSSISSTCSDSLISFTVVRLIQGISAAFLNTSAMALLNVLYPVGGNKDRAGAYKKWSMFLGMSFALGPVLGSLIVSWASWEWIMLINIPLGAIVVLPFIGGPGIKAAQTGNLGSVSLLSTLPATAVLLVITLIPFFREHAAGYHDSMLLIALLLCAAALLAMHLFYPRAFTRLPELKNGYFLASLLLPVIFSISYWSLFVTLPGYLALRLHATPLQTMLAMLCLSVPLTLFPVLKLQERVRLNANIGFLFLTAGLLSLAWLFNHSTTDSALQLALTLIVMGCGAAILNPVMARVVMDNVAPENSGLAAAITSTLRQTGFALGVAFYSLMTEAGLSGFNLSETEAFAYAACLPLVALLICVSVNRRSQLLAKAH